MLEQRFGIQFLYGNMICLIGEIPDNRNVPGDSKINRTLHSESLFLCTFAKWKHCYNYMETLHRSGSRACRRSNGDM